MKSAERDKCQLENKSAIQETCCICVEEFQKDSQVYKTSCGHVFHHECLQKWIQVKAKKRQDPDCP